MKNKLKLMMLCLGIIPLTSCMMNENNGNATYLNYAYDENVSYAKDNYSMDYTQYRDRPSQEISIPNSYHVGSSHSPVSFKDRDRNWVSSQSPQAYTIEIAEDEKASKVADKLYKAPKNDRMAQVKYLRNGKSYYKGLYGTYTSSEAAQKALDDLPPEVKQGAGVRNWGSIQGNLEPYE